MRGACKPHQFTDKVELARITPSLTSYRRLICETCGFEVWVRVQEVKGAEL